jgi:thiol-disulfide isomerase/thioredoxin
MSKQLILALLLFAGTKMTAQKFSLHTLEPGDTIPDIRWGEFLQCPLEGKSSDLKDKLIILDFWNIYCSPCFEGMKKLDSLQQRFKDKIQVILITKDKASDVERVFKKIKRTYPDLPMVVNDTVWSKLFPYESVPHHVWIDDKGKVKYISYGHNTNAGNIEMAINKEALELSYKKETGEIKKSGLLLLPEESELGSYLCYYSTVLKRIKSFGGGEQKYIRDSVKQIAGIRAINRPILSLFQETYGREYRFNNRIVLEVKQPESFQLPQDSRYWDEWYEKNLFCYELILPIEKANDIKTIMQQDLNRLFPFEARIEKRKVQSLVLTRLTKEDKLLSYGGTPVKQQVGDKIMLCNQPFHISLFGMIANANSDIPTPLIDGTNYKGNIDIVITSQLKNLELLRKDLNKYGFDLIQKEMEIDMLVIRDKW